MGKCRLPARGQGRVHHVRAFVAKPASPDGSSASGPEPLPLGSDGDDRRISRRTPAQRGGQRVGRQAGGGEHGATGLVHMAEGRRYSFDDAIRRRVRDFESALDQQRQAIEREIERRLADIERTAIEELRGLESAAADKTAQIHWVAAEQRHALGAEAEARSADLERTARVQQAAFEEAASSKTTELDHLGSDRIQAVMDAATDALEKLEQTAESEVRRIEAQAVTSRDAVRIEKQTATPDDTRWLAEHEVAALRRVVGQRIVELQDALRAQTELLDQLSRFSASASKQLAEARVTAGALRSAIEGLRRDVDAVLQPTRQTDAATRRGVPRPAAPAPSSHVVTTIGEETELRPIHWTTPTGETPPGR
jgi:hypothetical protein